MNTNNGLMFGMEGPNMEGTWYNPQTGDSFTVRNSFFQDNQYIVQTTDGRVLDYNSLQHYIQSDKPISHMDKPVVEESLPSEVMSLIEGPISQELEYGILPDDLDMISGNAKPLGNLSHPSHPSIGTLSNAPLTQNDQTTMMIEKALSKKTMPEIQVSIDWKDFPKREMDMLIDIMEVSNDDIVRWYLNQVDINYLADCLKLVIKDHIYSQTQPFTLPDIIDEVKIEKIEEPKSKPRRTNSKVKSKTKK